MFDFSSWCELLEHVAGQRASTAIDVQSGKLSVAVPGTALMDFFQFALPHNAVQRVSPIDVRLRRNVPVRWPFADNSRSFLKSARAVGYGAAYAIKAPRGMDGETPPVYVYPDYEVELNFEATDVPHLSDDAMAAASFLKDGKQYYPEWTRRTTVRFQPIAEQITLEASQLQYAEDTDGPRPRGVIGTPVSAPFAVIEQKALVTVTWQNVPAGFVLNNNRRPVQVFNTLGTVNSETFLDYAPMTLGLFDAPEFILKPLGLRNVNFVYQFPWQYDIVFRFRYFDPERAKALALFSGHNLVPYRGATKYLSATRRPFDSPATAGNWDVNGAPLFQSSDFMKLFQYWDY